MTPDASSEHVTPRPDPMRRLSPAEVADQVPAGWAHLMWRLAARYRTSDFATGLHLVDLIGESADRWDHHPDITLTYRDVVVTLVSHDVRGITSRDIRMARLVAEHAASLGLEPDVEGLTHVEPGLDTARGSELGPFYGALFNAPLVNGQPFDPSGQTPTLWWQHPEPVDEPDAREPAQRWHFDVWVAERAALKRLAAVIDAGGHLVSDAHAPAFWVVEDADGNRHCICTPAGR